MTKAEMSGPVPAQPYFWLVESTADGTVHDPELQFHEMWPEDAGGWVSGLRAFTALDVLKADGTEPIGVLSPDEALVRAKQVADNQAAVDGLVRVFEAKKTKAHDPLRVEKAGFALFGVRGWGMHRWGDQ